MKIPFVMELNVLIFGMFFVALLPALLVVTFGGPDWVGVVVMLCGLAVSVWLSHIAVPRDWR